MKIVHVTMVDAYSEGWAYHRNIISEKNKCDGNEVSIITTKYRMGDHGETVLSSPGLSYTKSGIKIIRLNDIVPLLPHFVQDRLHWTHSLYKCIENEKPQIIFVHNPQFINLGTVSNYKRNHPQVVLIGDTHADKFVSTGKHPRWSQFINQNFWGPLIRRNFKYFDKFCYIGLEQKKFFEEMYKISLKEAEFTPLPAPIVESPEKAELRKEIRAELGLDDSTFLFVHSGKLAKPKRTKDILTALRKNKINCRLVIIGSIPEDNDELKGLFAEEPRVSYLGWKSGDELRRYLAAADLYLQPGNMSVTMQNALACGTPVMIYPHESYKYFLGDDAIYVKNVDDILKCFSDIESDRSILNKLSAKAYEVAHKYFDIGNQAKMMYRLVQNKKEQNDSNN